MAKYVWKTISQVSMCVRPSLINSPGNCENWSHAFTSIFYISGSKDYNYWGYGKALLEIVFPTLAETSISHPGRDKQVADRALYLRKYLFPHSWHYTKLHLFLGKRSPMVWVVIIPKEGRASGASRALLFVWHRLFPKKKKSKKHFFQKKNLKSRCHTKRRAGAAPSARPSFGMTPTQDIRDLFAFPHS